MMIRALPDARPPEANLDPLGLATTPGDASDSTPPPTGFAEAGLRRADLLDFVLGLETATSARSSAILRRTYCGNVGVQYMHISDPKEKAWLQERSRAATRRSSSPRRARSPS
jgi:2-oxoglutarate dehydrogenase E1 component